MEYKTILTEVTEGVLVITLNRPEAKNAISARMWAEMQDALELWDADDSQRVAIITNTGDVFCAGADLKELAEGVWHGPEDKPDWGCGGYTKHFFEKPIICAVRGKALGGGLELVIAADLAVASSESIFGLPEPLVGLTAAGGGGLIRIAQQIPLKYANELLFTSNPVSAEKALEWGLLNYVVDDEEVMEKAMQIARDIVRGAPLSISCSKRTVYETMNESTVYPSPGWERLEEIEKITRGSRDALEGATAFAEKRKPHWEGR
ncbi:MAG: enoyl-CoA hydratase/isomerase family protein [Raoultibacter sp.]|jgi:crotonobetainyl-CoA hydratase